MALCGGFHCWRLRQLTRGPRSAGRFGSERAASVARRRCRAHTGSRGHFGRSAYMRDKGRRRGRCRRGRCRIRSRWHRGRRIGGFLFPHIWHGHLGPKLVDYPIHNVVLSYMSWASRRFVAPALKHTQTGYSVCSSARHEDPVWNAALKLRIVCLSRALSFRIRRGFPAAGRRSRR